MRGELPKKGTHKKIRGLQNIKKKNQKNHHNRDSSPECPKTERKTVLKLLGVMRGGKEPPKKGESHKKKDTPKPQ